MFAPIEVPYGCKMLFNVVDLKDGYTIEDVELLLGEMCNVVKNNYGDDNGGFIEVKFLKMMALSLMKVQFKTQTIHPIKELTKMLVI